MATTESILASILGCGTADLSLLEHLGYDIDLIIEDCIDDGDLSFYGIIRRVADTAAFDLQKALDEQRDAIRDAIHEQLAFERSEFIDSGEMTEEELNECDDYKELIRDLELLNSNELRPVYDVDIAFNFLDTQIGITNLGWYKRWMESTVEVIEDKMGFSFSDL